MMIKIDRLSKIKQKVSKAHTPPAVAITGHTMLIRKKEKWTNKGTDKQAKINLSTLDLFIVIHLVVLIVCTKFDDCSTYRC